MSDLIQGVAIACSVVSLHFILVIVWPLVLDYWATQRKFDEKYMNCRSISIHRKNESILKNKSYVPARDLCFVHNFQKDLAVKKCFPYIFHPACEIKIQEFGNYILFSIILIISVIQIIFNALIPVNCFVLK